MSSLPFFKAEISQDGGWKLKGRVTQISEQCDYRGLDAN